MSAVYPPYLVLFALFVLYFHPTAQQSPTIQNYTLSQRQDHFNPENQRTFQQRYWVSTKYYTSSNTTSPILLYISDFCEPEVDLEGGAIGSWASSLNAIAVLFEVRYSGDSNPVANYTSFDLKFQSFDQNLADIQFFLYQFSLNFPEHSARKWIIIGEYLQGNTALWVRELLPQYVLGGVGVAAPVYAMTDFYQYQNFFATLAGSDCAQLIHSATELTEQSLSEYPSSSLKAMFSCSDITDDTQFFYVISQVITFGIANFRDQICSELQSASSSSSFKTDNINNIVTMNDQTTMMMKRRANHRALKRLFPTEHQTLRSTEAYYYDDLVVKFAGIINVLIAYSGTTCAQWDLAFDQSHDIGSSFADFRPTFYLFCTQLGQFEVAGPPGPDVIFSSLLTTDWFTSICAELFNMTTTEVPPVDYTNYQYGGLNPWGSNYAYVNTLSDPYIALNINSTSLPNSQAINIPTNETLWEFISGVNVDDEIQQGRENVLNLMISWLQESPSASQSATSTPTPSASSPNDNNGNGTHTVLIVIITISVILAVSLIVSGGIYYYVRRRKTELSYSTLS